MLGHLSAPPDEVFHRGVDPKLIYYGANKLDVVRGILTLWVNPIYTGVSRALRTLLQLTSHLYTGQRTSTALRSM